MTTVSPCPLAKFRVPIDDLFLKQCFDKLNPETLAKRIDALPSDLKRRAIKIQQACWIS